MIAYQSSLGVLYHQDCIAGMDSLTSNSVDTIFADPPFNLDKFYEGYDDNRLDYWEWTQMWLSSSVRVLKSGGAFFVYHIPQWNFRIANELERLGLEFRHWIALSMKGTYPIRGKLYPAHYSLLYFTKGRPNTFNRLRTPIQTCRHCRGDVKDYGGHRSKLHPDGLSLTDFWDDTSPNRHRKSKSRMGVNELPLIIPERAILTSTNAGDLVVDPFGGGGSTYEACEKNNRHWIGFEIGECSYAIDRLTNMEEP